MHARLLSFRPTPATAIAMVVLLFALTGFAGAANGAAPQGANGKGQVTVVTLIGGPVEVDTPLDPDDPVPYTMSFSPSSSTSFTQKAGEVVTITMAAEFVGDGDTLLCDVHAAVDLTPESPTGGGIAKNAVAQTFIAQRGGPWYHTLVGAADSTRTIPAPATDISRTVIGVAWMDSPDPSSPDPGCFVDGNPTAITVSVRLSIVTLRN